MPGQAGIHAFLQTSHLSSQIPIHHHRIHKPQNRMPESPRQPPHHRKPKIRPQPHRPLIRTHHKIELHGPKPQHPRSFQRKRTHRPRHPAPTGILRHHIPAIGHMPPATQLVCPQHKRAHDDPIQLSDKHLIPSREPIPQRLAFRKIPRQSIGLSRPNNRLKNPPNRPPIPIPRRPNLQTTPQTPPSCQDKLASTTFFKQVRKNFFFEKKKQKTSAPLRAVFHPRGLNTYAGRH